jgi:hypothetical protein
MQDRTELSRLDHVTQFVHLRVETPVVSESERDTGFVDGFDSDGRIGLCQCERLLAEHVLAVFGSGDSLWTVLRMRRDKNNSIDIVVRNNVFVRFLEFQVVFVGEGFRIVGERARRPCHEADMV